LEFILHHSLLVLFTLVTLAILVVWFVRRPVSPEEAANWPVIEGTIQLVTRVPVKNEEHFGSLHVGDFSYTVNNEYYSGRVMITRSFSSQTRSPQDLVNQKIQVRYNPRKPEKYSVPSQELADFLLDPYDEAFGSDVGSIHLNLDED
jgi:hypothetical protein